MMFDRQNTVSENQAFTTGTQRSTDVIDLWTPAVGGTDANGNTLLRDPARSPALSLHVQVTEDFASGTNETWNVITGLDGDPTVASPTVVATTGAVLEATMKKGRVLQIEIPPLPTTARYLALQGVASGTHTTGKVTAGIVGSTGKQTSPGSVLP